LPFLFERKVDHLAVEMWGRKVALADPSSGPQGEHVLRTLLQFSPQMRDRSLDFLQMYVARN
jgi:hypothetical protein